MKKRSFVSLLLAAVLLFGGCKNGNGGQTQDSGSADTSVVEDTGRTVSLTSNKKANYKIVISENASESVAAAADALKERLKTVTNARFAVSDDFTREGEIAESSGEIIIGNCKRTETQNVLRELTYRDYAVKITDANIVIAGYEDAKIVDAVYSFMELLNSESVTEGEDGFVLRWERDYVNSYSNYKLQDITVGGVSLSQYRIVYPSESNVEYYYLMQAKNLQDIIGRRCGLVLDICSDAESAQPYEILMGETNRAESKAFYGADTLSNMEYSVLIENGKLVLAGGGIYSVTGAISGLDSKLAASKDGVLDAVRIEGARMINGVPAEQGDYRFMTYNVMADLTGYWSDYGRGLVREPDIRKDVIAGLVRAYRPAVLAVEEVFENWYEQLSAELAGDYTFVPLRTDAGVNRTMLVYDHSRVKLIEHGYVSADSLNSPNNRCVAWGVFEDLNDGTQFAVFGGHFSISAMEHRVAEAEIMVDTIEAVTARYDVPVIAMGDFNADLKGVVADVFLNRGYEQACGKGYDHLYCTNGFYKVASGVETNNYAHHGSDHWPIWADVAIQATS